MLGRRFFLERRLPVPPGPGPSELADAYKSIVYACVNLNANAVARAPLRLFAVTRAHQAGPRCAVEGVTRGTLARLGRLDYAAKSLSGAERVEEVTAHPLLDAVMRVNDDLDHTQLITYTAMSLDIVGSAYWWPALDRLGLPEELWALPPHLVFPVFTSGTMVPDAYSFGGVMYPKGELVRFRRLSAKNPYGQGYGPLQAAIEYARLEDTYVSIQDDLLANGPRPSVIVSHRDPKGTFGPAERQRLEAELERRGRGGRAGGVLVVDGAATVAPFSYSPTDLGALRVSSYDLERIANGFDVPVSMLKTEGVNRANAEAGLEQHARNAVEPRCRLIASALTRWTHSLDRDGTRGWDRLVWAFDPVVTEDREAEAQQHRTYLDLGVITRNEVRLDLGYAPAEGGDELLIPGNLALLTDVSAEPDPEDESVVAGNRVPGEPGHRSVTSPCPRAPHQRERLFADPHAVRDYVVRGKKPPSDGEGAPSGGKKPPSGGKKPPSGDNCGTGAGGFQPGNECQRRGRKPKTPPKRRPKKPAEAGAPEAGSPKPPPSSTSGGRGRRRRPQTSTSPQLTNVDHETFDHYIEGRIPGPNPNNLIAYKVEKPTKRAGVYLKPMGKFMKVGSSGNFRTRYSLKAGEWIRIEILQTRTGPPEGVDDSIYPWNPRAQRRFDEEYVDRMTSPRVRYRDPTTDESPVQRWKWEKYRHIFGYGGLDASFGLPADSGEKPASGAARRRRRKKRFRVRPAWRGRAALPAGFRYREFSTMNELLLELLNRLDAIGADNHEEIYDSECRSQMRRPIFLGFIKPEKGYVVPDDFGLYSPEANRAVREALVRYIDAANAKAAELGIHTFHERLAAFQTNDVRSDVEWNYFDDFFSWSNPDHFDEKGNVIKMY